MKFKRFSAFFMIVVLCVLMLPAQAFASETVASGTCGKNLTWELDDTGTLTISGTGAMNDYILGSPWEDYRDSIIHVVIEEGVTTIGVSAFQSYKNMISVTLPNTLTKIENWAFAFSEKLSSIAIPSSVTKIGVEAFASCYGLQGVYITDLSAWMNIQFEGGEYSHNPECANPLYWGKENKLYLNGELLTEVTIPDGITEIGPAVLSSTALEKVIIPDGVTSIGEFAFSSCTSLTDVTIADSVTSIGGYAFQNCSALESITLPNSITSIGEYAFYICDKLSEITIPDSVTTIGRSAFCQCDALTNATILAGITSIPDSAFYGCDKLASVTIPAGVTSIGKNAFIMCYALDNIYFNGTGAQWTELLNHVAEGNSSLLYADVHINGNPMVVYSDAANLQIEIGETITISAGILVDEQTMGDPSGITFQFSDGYTVNILDTGIDKETNCFYIVLEGAIEGNTSVTFSDSATGKAVSIPLTIQNEAFDAYTLETVPEFTVTTGPIVEGPVNFYNHNGLYVDTFISYVNNDGSAKVSFDVYNTNCTYGIVEVFDENGDLYNAVLLDKMDSLNGSIKEVLWDGTGCFVRDIFSGNALTYKQETNFSKRTSVEIEIPKNGYIRITADPLESGILAVVNSADLMMSSLSLMGKAEGFQADSDFPDELVVELSKDANYEQLLKDGKKICEGVMKGIGKDAAITSKTVGDFTDTLMKNLTELNLMGIILDSAKGTGVDIAEDTVKEMMGIFGDALDAVFLIGSAEDLARQYISYIYSFEGGVITIQNQGGGKRHCDNIILESEADFDPEVALQVYTVVLDEELLEKVKNADQETYELLTKGIMHTYNISLLKNGEETQHSGDVTVYIPIPDDLEYLALNGHLKVFRMEEDGSMTDMDAVVQGDTVMFTTDHFSLYVLVGYEAEATPVDPTEPDADTTEPTAPAGRPTEKEDPSDSDDEEPQTSNGGGIVTAIIIVAVVVLAGMGAAFVLLKKKKQA